MPLQFHSNAACYLTGPRNYFHANTFAQHLLYSTCAEHLARHTSM
ncbi:hypothetical protein K239x_39150 [Planctomycetes bacterium K23_9]|uniref:Uncharacterized protein n=1 Tax=Stieleria marina TaxID=1930275 RepID=A0A517NXQ8_9BACT|nr:hypothetical protein K239x_39150 [Planctomycetes bacterium K23_9]